MDLLTVVRTETRRTLSRIISGRLNHSDAGASMNDLRIILLAVFLYPACFAGALADPLADGPPKREFRGAWVATVLNLDWPGRPGQPVEEAKALLREILDDLQANGVSAVMFQVRSECDAMYESPFEPWSYWLTGVQGAPPVPAFDPLEFAVSEAHARGMELHAWFNPYRAVRNTNGYSTAPSHVTRRNPSWVLTFAEKGTSDATDSLRILDPGHPDVREYDAMVIADVVRRYDVDGVHMDDYFYPYPPNQITNQDAATFAAYPRGFANIADWRRDNVNLLLRMIRDSLMAIKPHVKFGVSPFGIWKSGVPPGIVGLDAYSTIYCDALAWLRDGSIDYLTPQLYWQIGGGQDYAALMPWWADSVARYGRHFYPGMAAHRIVNWPAAEVPSQIRLNRQNPKVGGEIFFRAQAGVNDNPKGFADTLQNDLYRYPALHPVMAWKDTVRPNSPLNVSFGRPADGAPPGIHWDLPPPASDGDSASRYAVYRFDHSPAPGEFDDARNMLSVVGGRFVVPPTPRGVGGPFYFGVTALDRNYNESPAGNVLAITVPPSPILAAPFDGIQSLPESVIVTWNEVPFASRYRLQVSTDPSFESSILLDDSTLTDTSRTVKDLAGEAAHYWRVGAEGPGGVGSFSEAWSFSTAFPAQVALLSPADATLNVPLTTVLQWDGNPAAATYSLQLSTTGNFAAPVVDTAGVTDTALAIGPLQSYRIYFWRVRATNGIGTGSWSAVFRFRTVQVVAVDGETGLPSDFALGQNFPNPFNPATIIRYDVPSAGDVRLAVYDLLGREVAVLVDEMKQAGRHEVRFDASGLASGAYVYRLTAGLFAQSRWMMLVR